MSDKNTFSAENEFPGFYAFTRDAILAMVASGTISLQKAEITSNEPSKEARDAIENNVKALYDIINDLGGRLGLDAKNH